MVIVIIMLVVVIMWIRMVMVTVDDHGDIVNNNDDEENDAFLCYFHSNGKDEDVNWYVDKDRDQEMITMGTYTDEDKGVHGDCDCDDDDDVAVIIDDDDDFVVLFLVVIVKMIVRSYYSGQVLNVEEEGEVEVEDEDDSDDEVSLQPRAFQVYGEPCWDSGPPQDGFEYLRRVM